MSEGAYADDSDLTDQERYEIMVKEMKYFVHNHPRVKSLRLRLQPLKPGDYLIYQGAATNDWAYLRPQRCAFVRPEFLRVLHNLPDNYFLWKFFDKYDLRGGLKVNYPGGVA